MAKITANSILETISGWIETANRRINPGDLVAVTMRVVEDPVPEKVDEVCKNKELEEGAVQDLKDPQIIDAQIRYESTRADLDKMEYFTLDQKIRYGMSRRASMIASANNIDRIARDTAKEFERP